MADIWGEVGTSAGKLWTALNNGKPATLAEVKKKTGLDDNMMAMAIGWLAREEKVIIDRKGAVVSVKLK
ncbi:MAG: winged helix-turn-helix domain-containing protein [Candidatus Altiarchaeota archaeon]